MNVSDRITKTQPMQNNLLQEIEGSIKTYLKTEFRNIKFSLKDLVYDEL